MHSHRDVLVSLLTGLARKKITVINSLLGTEKSRENREQNAPGLNNTALRELYRSDTIGVQALGGRSIGFLLGFSRRPEARSGPDVLYQFAVKFPRPRTTGSEGKKLNRSS